MMKMEEIVRILKLHNNIYLHKDTINEYSKEEIEKEVGFEIEVANVVENGFILERVNKNGNGTN